MKTSLFQDFIHLFYPAVCNGCSTPLLSGEHFVCLQCKSDLPVTNYHLINDNKMERLFTGRIQIERATAFVHFIKNGKVQSLLHHLKYKSNSNLGLHLGKMMALSLKDSSFYDDFDMIVPIPLHPKKLKTRGYNQSEKIAEGFSSISSIPLNNELLIRSTFTESQTRKSKFNRWQNVSSVFEVSGSSKTKGKHILLIDDVITTGSTLESAAALLTEKLNAKISIATFAIA